MNGCQFQYEVFGVQSLKVTITEAKYPAVALVVIHLSHVIVVTIRCWVMRGPVQLVHC